MIQKCAIIEVMNVEEHKNWCKQNRIGDKRVGNLLDDFEGGKMGLEEFKRRIEVLKTEGK